MTAFFRFPHTAHLVWLGDRPPRDDKVLLPSDAESLLQREVVVEEKIDGANIGFSVDVGGELRAQSRGNYLYAEHEHPQFRLLWTWLQARSSGLIEVLGQNRILFGEWCYAVHSVSYSQLPDWFLGFDVYDRASGKFWDTSRRNELLKTAGLHSVPHIARGRFGVEELTQLLSRTSAVGDGPIEGLVVRQESVGFTTARAKLVRQEFAQAIEEHWSRRPLQRNELAKGTAPWS